MEDSRIIDLFLKRDAAALTCTSEKYGGRLRNASKRITGDFGTAEECENDTYLRAWEAIPPHEPRDYFFAFLLRIIRALSIDAVRANQRLKRSAELLSLTEELEECILSPQNTEGEIEARLLGESISRFLKTIPEERRRIFIRRYFYLDTVAEIGERLSISESKVKSALFRTRKELGKWLKKEGYEV